MLQASCREREQLQRENDALKRELERLRRSATVAGPSYDTGKQNPSSITTTTVAPSSTNKEVAKLNPEGEPSVADPPPPISNSEPHQHVPTRSQTTSPTSASPLEHERVRTPSSTVHAKPYAVQYSTPPPPNSNDTPSAVLDPSHVSFASALPTPSSSYSWTHATKPDNAPEAFSDSTSP